MKVAALDLGTNSFLCLIAEGEKGQITKILSDEVEIVRLGQDVNLTKIFHPDALIRARTALKKFSETIIHHRPDKVLAMATSAARDVKNANELFKICEELNIPLEIIKGSDEARITFKGSMAGKNSFIKKKALVIDIGGGSTELILGENEKILYSHSLDIGAVRLKEMFVNEEILSKSVLSDIESYISMASDQHIRSILEFGSIEISIAVAGTPTELVSSLIGGFNKEKIENYNLKLQEIVQLRNALAEVSNKDRIEKFYINSGRADIITVGATILLQLLKQFNLSQTIVSTQGVRHGVAIELLEN